MTQLGAVVAFDIETVPDADVLRRFYELPEASDEEICGHARDEALARSDGRSDFLPIAFHKVAVISAVVRDKSRLHINSKSPPQHDEADVVSSFFNLIDRLKPTLVSWNGNGFDLPVLHARALKHKVTADGYWQGPGDKWHQYASRYHGAHQDVMDILAMHNPRSFSKLESIALLCGLPGKMGYGGDQVYKMHLDGKHVEIANYCEIDALNTYLLWLRLQLLRGNLTPNQHDEECTLVENHLASSAPHLQQFLEQWLKFRD